MRKTQNVGLVSRDDVARVFNSLCKIADRGGFWSDDTRLVVEGLAETLGVEVNLPATSVTTIITDALFAGATVEDPEVMHVEN